MPDESNATQISISQAYLELARSYLTAVAESKTNDVSNPAAVDQHNRATTTFALAALSTVFSYSALEAFVNYELFQIWQHSRYAHDIIEKIKSEDPSRQYRALYDAFYHKYGKVSTFFKLKNTELRELTERIKAICRAREIPSIAVAKPDLWRDLRELEDTRHHLIHPVPDDEKINEIVTRLFTVEPYKKYPDLVVAVMTYFYQTFNAPVPEHFSENRLFRVSGIEILF